MWTGGKKVTMFLRFQMKTHLKMILNERQFTKLVRPFSGKHGTLKVNKMHKQNDSGGYRMKNRYNV